MTRTTNRRSKPSKRVPVGEFQRALARQAAIEKSMAGMIPLECGHYTDRETREQFRAFGPPKGKAMCETCGDWRGIKYPPRAVPGSNQDSLF